jgi:autotransporter-associated beta strand protein
LTDVQDGVLRLGADLALLSDLQTSGGTLDLDGYSTNAGTVTVLSGAIVGSGTASLSGSAYLVESGTISANLGDLNPSALTKTTSGTLVLSGSNGYKGGTVVNDGTLLVTNSRAIYDGTNLSVGEPTLLVLLPEAIIPSAAIPSTSVVAGLPTESSSAAIAPVPEPGTLALFVAGAICAAAAARRRVRRRK